MTLDLAQLPEALQPIVARHWEQYQSLVDASDVELLLSNTTIRNSLPKIWGCSSFAAKYAQQQPAAFAELVLSGDLGQRLDNCAERLARGMPKADALNDASLMQYLRQFRRREMVRIIWRDLAGWAELTETLEALSNLADACIACALDFHYAQLAQQFGTPMNRAGQAQQLVVLGMGKLGGQELNFSSDIDLIFAYPEDGETQHERRSRTNQEFFVRLGQQIINCLNQVTADGFVFRVDMRLRPFGDSGPLVMHFDAMEDYYQTHARDWERYALVKARVVAGDMIAGTHLLNELRPFIYRRYLDYGAFEALRTMKALIDQETRRKGLENNLKLGAGGIREVEFSCQVFQLIRGGRQTDLQSRHLLSTLKRLQHHGFLSDEEAEQLTRAYYFLRHAENHLQAIEDQQTQTLPDDALNQTRLAFSMGVGEWSAFHNALQDHQQKVHHIFSRVIAPVHDTQQSDNQETLAEWQSFWLRQLVETEAAQEKLSMAGFRDAASLVEHLQRLAQSKTVQRLSARARERLDKLVPLTLHNLAQLVVPSPEQAGASAYDAALHRLLDLIEAIALRSVYMALLLERLPVLQQLVKLCLASAWIAEQITRYPLLLDELLDHRDLYDMLQAEELDNALQAQLAHLPNDDMEMQMDSMRQFKRANVLKVAASEVSCHLTVEVASDYLAAIADTLTRRALSLAWEYVTRKHGLPTYRENDKEHLAGFCVVAYGKAGGIELSYGSDLDMVFLHDSHSEQQYTNGEKMLDNSVFFVRLAQRIIHILTTNTAAGTLYEVDPRLRPGGASGLLVSNLEAFLTYQREEAWTWEHQALVRARAIAGDAQCMQRFEQIRREILSLPRDEAELRQGVREMRYKMREHLDKTTDEMFDLKQGSGGVTDIEFIIQYGMLRWAATHPELMDTTGMLPLLRMFSEQQLLPTEACEQLSEAYRRYRAETHKLALQNKPAQVPVAQIAEVRAQVQTWWSQLMEQDNT